MSKVTPIRSADPCGRVDVLVTRLIEESCKMLVAPRSQQLWDVLKPHIEAVAKKQVRKLGIMRRPLNASEMAVIEKVLDPRRFKCTG